MVIYNFSEVEVCGVVDEKQDISLLWPNTPFMSILRCGYARWEVVIYNFSEVEVCGVVDEKQDISLLWPNTPFMSILRCGYA